MENFGNRLYKSTQDVKILLFVQGEMAQLSYQAFDAYAELVKKEESDKISITYPIGFRADNTPINSTQEYTKEHLIQRYEYLALDKLPLDGIYQLVTLMETLFGEIIRMTLIEFPGKIGNKRKIDSELALSASSIDEIKISIVNSILNELAYKNPKDYAEEFNKYIGINLLESPPITSTLNSKRLETSTSTIEELLMKFTCQKLQH
ncbi:hypothetical protein [Roseivirga pacifica]|uniref:hypothetical protein n=1 Tax=Roseivirga pacifica TaxID=1267423 RepID=UPI00227CF150|nr:hypothetical protein [Roseivirga pacifica]